LMKSAQHVREQQAPGALKLQGALAALHTFSTTVVVAVAVAVTVTTDCGTAAVVVTGRMPQHEQAER